MHNSNVNIVQSTYCMTTSTTSWCSQTPYLTVNGKIIHWTFFIHYEWDIPHFMLAY